MKFLRKKNLVILLLYLIITIGLLLIPMYWITIKKGATEYKMWFSGIFYICIQFDGGNFLRGFILSILHLIVPVGIINLVRFVFKNKSNNRG